jgi:excisionase family DNA binding protein
MSPLLTRSDVCDLLGISMSTLDRWIQQGRFPPPQPIGPRSPRWRRESLDAFLGASAGGFH